MRKSREGYRVETRMNPQLHPLNKPFEWQEASAPFRIINDAQAAQWNEGGYFLLEGAFDAAELAPVIADIDPMEAKTNAF